MVRGVESGPNYGRRARLHGGLHFEMAKRTQLRVQRCSVRAIEMSKRGPRFVHKTVRALKARRAHEKVQQQNKRFKNWVIKNWKTLDNRARRAQIPWVRASETLATHVPRWEPAAESAS